MPVDSLPTSRKRRVYDRAAALMIKTAGFGLVALVLLILWYLLGAALPLGRAVHIGAPVSVELRRQTAAPAADGAAPGSSRREVSIAGPEGWELDREGVFRCGEDGDVRPLPRRVATPPVAAVLAESGNALLVLDAEAKLHRFAAASCELRSMGPARSQPAAADTLLGEVNRPVAIVLAQSSGRVRILNSASGTLLFDGMLPAYQEATGFALAADGSYLQGRLRSDADRVLRWPLINLYPEAGWRSLWAKVWYPGYDAPSFVWHPGNEGVGSLPKYSLTPLLFGTFKAALYGMLIAIPIGLGAAVYTGYFLPPRLRNRIKPAVELLEAFPTVVLGFIAGLWLAPLLSDYLFLLFALPLLLLALPVLLAVSQPLLPRSPAGYRAPSRIVTVFLAYLLGTVALILAAPGLEHMLFDGEASDWLLNVFGVHYEQRNALLVGLAMGVSLVPTLFSIVEDAIFAVPRSLSDGSLALGATRWQSLARVVLPAASPAILSAVLIALARGLGETMIVLLATGNTPIMDASAFNGMRTLSASLAAELPEASVGGLQFRVLFLAAVVLFALTFVLNTLAELFRQRLRYRYAGR